MQYDVTAVLANDVLPNALGVTINANPQVTIGGVVVGGDSNADGIGDNVGGPLKPAGGTLVYNPRGTVVPAVTSCAVDVDPCPAGQVITLAGGAGPLNDPTAILYALTDDLVPVTGADTAARRRDPAVPVRLRDTAPVEPAGAARQSGRLRAGHAAQPAAGGGAGPGRLAGPDVGGEPRAVQGPWPSGTRCRCTSSTTT